MWNKVWENKSLHCSISKLTKCIYNDKNDQDVLNDQNYQNSQYLTYFTKFFLTIKLIYDHSESPTDLDTNIFSVINYNENPEVFLRIAFSLI